MSVIPDISEFDRQAARLALMDFVPWATPKFAAPKHFEQLVDSLTGIVLRDEVHKLVVGAPPQHGKTEAVAHFIAWALWLKPTLRISYTTFSAARARRIARKVRELLDRLGVVLTSRLIIALETKPGGCLLSCGINGPLNGEGIDIAIIDDPYKNRRDAESAAVNEAAWEWVEDVWLNRGHSRTSYLVFATRWTPNDISGRLLKHRQGWQWLAFPALHEGKSLWPTRWTPKQLAEKRDEMSPLSWDSLWQQQPRPRGQTLFTDAPGVYTQLPVVYVASFGLDCAYSLKTSADSSAVVKMLKGRDGFYYVTLVRVVQWPIRRLKRFCRKLHRKEPAATWLWYTSTTESGVAELFNEGPREVPLQAELASRKGDKRERAIAFADAWNQGKVLVPRGAPWAADFIANVMDFTGAEGGVDDDVDAAVASFDQLAGITASVAEVKPPRSLRRKSLYAG